MNGRLVCRLLILLALPAALSAQDSPVAKSWDRAYGRDMFIYGKEPIPFLNCRIRYYEDGVTDLHDGMHEGKGAIVRLIAEKPAHP